jgi:ribonuclease R
MRYAIGTRVRVQVSRVDLDGRRIDFRLVREGEELLTRAMKDKGMAQEGAARVAKEGAPAKAGRQRAARKAAASQERVPPSATPALKPNGDKAAAKSKGRKTRRRP